jgi:hypothetical protein
LQSSFLLQNALKTKIYFHSYTLRKKYCLHSRLLYLFTPQYLWKKQLNCSSHRLDKTVSNFPKCAYVLWMETIWHIHSFVCIYNIIQEKKSWLQIKQHYYIRKMFRLAEAVKWANDSFEKMFSNNKTELNIFNLNNMCRFNWHLFWIAILK